ncbi:putative acyl-activating enzyme 6 [Citrus sinensis]|nr:putative acyl-activating enzyme 6 [Citrus sinensis]
MDQLKPNPANSCPLTPLGFIERAATAYDDCPSIIYNDTTYTWSQTYRRCLQLASSLFSFAVSLFPPHSKTPKLVLITDDKEISSSSSPPPRIPPADFVDTYENMLAKGDPQFSWVRPKSDLDRMVLNYTSGTTSAPKGVVQCHKALFIIAVDSLIDWSVPKQSVLLWTLPMFHNNGWSFTWGAAAVGATNVCLRKFDAPTVFALIRKHGVTHMCGAPIVLNLLSSSPEAKPLDRPVHILTAGSPPPAPVLLRTESLGFIVSHGYGITEDCWCHLDIVDPKTGLSVKRDGLTRGEIVMRGGSLMLGYLKDPEATSKCMKDGRYYTGDVGVMHPDGYLEIKDRSKDVIISGGENISSAEIESVLYSHPVVNEAAVVGRPDPFWQEIPCAFVSLKTGTDSGGMMTTEKDIIQYCRARIPRYMVPKTVVIIDELPKTATSKVQKYVLRDIANSMSMSHSRM